MKKCYISGKITGMPKEDYEYNFNVSAKYVETINYTAVNPIKVCPYVEGKGWMYYMVRVVPSLFFCSAIYMQSNWKESKGARIERLIAKLICLKIIYEK
jgi:hypothetical protein